MQMQRGDVVVVAAAGDHGKPRPAVIVQTDAFPQSHASVVFCQLTSELVDAPDFRVAIEPQPENGLRLKSQVMADKPVTVKRERVGQKIGSLGNQDMARLGIALAWGLRINNASGAIDGGQASYGCRRLDAAISAARQLYRAKSHNGAPRPMKTGTIASPWRHDPMR